MGHRPVIRASSVFNPWLFASVVVQFVLGEPFPDGLIIVGRRPGIVLRVRIDGHFVLATGLLHGLDHLWHPGNLNAAVSLDAD